jgi:hypothetical protein
MTTLGIEPANSGNVIIDIEIEVMKAVIMKNSGF